MREHRYRVWCEEDKIMITDLNSPTMQHGRIVFGEGYEPMQYIDLKDMHGKDICEGDIVKDRWHTFAVEYEDCGYSPFEYSGGGEMSPEDCEIIGNIHENPELLG